MEILEPQNNTMNVTHFELTGVVRVPHGHPGGKAPEESTSIDGSGALIDVRLSLDV